MLRHCSSVNEVLLCTYKNERQKKKTKMDQECNICWKDHLGGQWVRIGSREQRGSGSSSPWHQLLPFLRLTATVDASYPSSSAALLCTWPSNWASVHTIWAQISGKLFPTQKKQQKKTPPWKPPASSSCSTKKVGQQHSPPWISMPAKGWSPPPTPLTSPHSPISHHGRTLIACPRCFLSPWYIPAQLCVIWVLPPATPTGNSK